MTGRGGQDSDLADLLGNAAPPPLRGRAGNNQATAMNLDHLTTGKVSVSPTTSPSGNSGYGNHYAKYHSNANQRMSCLDFVQGYISMLCFYYPKACACCTITLLLGIMAAIAVVTLNPTIELGMVSHHDNVRSKYDLSVSKVDHWCLRGGNDNCKCEDPLVPLGRAEHLSWLQAHENNKKSIDQRISDAPDNDVNIAFIGESVVEAMSGRWMGMTRSANLKQLTKTFDRHFKKSAKEGLYGVALGIAGDTAPNVLWRLQHGELPAKLQPKIFWLSLGMNDLARMQCSEEIVVLGILRVVEELLDKRPNAHIVLNSIFPMGSVRGGSYPVLSDFRDAFKPGERERTLLVPTSATKQLMSSKQQPSSTSSSAPHGRRLRRNRGDDDDENKKFRKGMTRAEKVKMIEEMRDKAYQRTHKREANMKKRPVNPRLDNRKRIHQRPIAGVQRTTFPYWVSIKAINDELRRFARSKGNDRVHWFDSTRLFMQSSGGAPRLNSRLITMRGHPTPSGFAVWEESIKKEATKILDKMRAEEPELFQPPTSAFSQLSSWFTGGGGDGDEEGGEYEDGDGMASGDGGDSPPLPPPKKPAPKFQDEEDDVPKKKKPSKPAAYDGDDDAEVKKPKKKDTSADDWEVKKPKKKDTSADDWDDESKYKKPKKKDTSADDWDEETKYKKPKKKDTSADDWDEETKYKKPKKKDTSADDWDDETKYKKPKKKDTSADDWDEETKYKKPKKKDTSADDWDEETKYKKPKKKDTSADDWDDETKYKKPKKKDTSADDWGSQRTEKMRSVSDDSGVSKKKKKRYSDSDEEVKKPKKKSRTFDDGGFRSADDNE